MDKPGAQHWEFWKKPGFSRNDTAKYFSHVCGYRSRQSLVAEDPRLAGIQLAEKWESFLILAEECMLKNGFAYVDKPDGLIEAYTGGPCERLDLQHRPSCQSLKDQRK
jgi:hypothetical protein